jgi:hypothetical protein
MSPTDLFSYISGRFAVATAVVCLGVGGGLLWRFHQVPSGALSTEAPPVQNVELQAPDPLADIDWTPLHDRGGGHALNMGVLAKRFRLAGTYQVVDPQGQVTRRAILDESGAESRQRIVREGEQFDDIEIRRILLESIVIVGPSGEEQLWLSFSSPVESGTSGHDGEMSIEELLAAGGFDEYGGKRIGENRWLFRRADLVDYYQELRDNPERLLKVFDSMKPLYDANRQITGYFLGTEGEGKFFNSVGLLEGDVVRSVNSMEMTNRRRAEYFINEFVSDRLNAFVIELERAGEKQQFVYEVR